MELDFVYQNNLRDHLIVSDYDKKSFEGVELCLGIDEAGRGPVLGPMVYSALFCPRSDEQQLKEMECAGKMRRNDPNSLTLSLYFNHFVFFYQIQRH